MFLRENLQLFYQNIVLHISNIHLFFFLKFLSFFLHLEEDSPRIKIRQIRDLKTLAPNPKKNIFSGSWKLKISVFTADFNGKPQNFCFLSF